jgi:hypothetical protein
LADVQTLQWQPIIGTPMLVPVPSRVSVPPADAGLVMSAPCRDLMSRWAWSPL